MILKCVMKGFVNSFIGMQPFHETSGGMYTKYVQFVNRLKVKSISDSCQTCIIVM